MTTVCASSRLHFGPLGLADAARWPNLAGEPSLPGRAFGGVGLMVQDPGVRLRVTPAPAWLATGPCAERALGFAQHYAAAVRQERPDHAPVCQAIAVQQAAPEHAGLGTGTQLGLATALALARAWGLDEPADVLARRVGRGLRSAVGVHGFAHGGFLVEAGKRSPDQLSPMVARLAFPEAWRVVLILQPHEPGLHGASEREAFARLTHNPSAPRQTEALCRIVLQGLLPALVEGDFAAFGEALHEFNARSGEMFAAVQGGVYAGAAVADAVGLVRSLGVKGVGQSSWGPTVFAVVKDDESATDLALRVRQHFGPGLTQTIITRACNHGAMVS
jgi:beta-ribofuranosylaminobenzene 5'-phosphate synthase